MQLQGRNLEKGLTGADVSLLHFELKIIGYPPPEDEILNNTFGPGTQQAVQNFQGKNSLKQTGIVDAATAKAINAKVAEQVSIDAVLVQLGEEIARYQMQIDQLRQGNPDLAKEVTRLRTALEAMQIECEQVRKEATASAGQVTTLEQALAAARTRIAELEKLVDNPNGGQDGGFLVRGHVRTVDGTPLAGLPVRAYDMDLPSLQRDQPLGEIVTNAAGFYQIAYTADQFSRLEKATADLQVRVYDPQQPIDDKTPPLVASVTRFNAQPEETVDLVVENEEYRSLSEFERIVAALTPLIDTIHIDDLTAADVAFLARETDFDPQWLTWLVIAHRHARTANRLVEAAFFYGLLREGLPAELTALLAQGPTVLRDALKRAVAEQIIPAALLAKLEEVLAQLKDLRVGLALEVPEKQQPTPLAVILSTALPEPEQQRIFLTRYNDHQGEIEEFWRDLRKHPTFADGVVDQLQFSLQLGALTGGNAPLVQALRQDQTLTSTRSLANLDETYWRARIAATAGEQGEQIPAYIAGSTLAEKITNYTGSIIATLQAAFPMAYVARGLATAPTIDVPLVNQVLALNPDWDARKSLLSQINWGDLTADVQKQAQTALAALQAELAIYRTVDTKSALAGGSFSNSVRAGVNTFLKNVPDFDLGAVNIDSFVKSEEGVKAFVGIDAADQPLVTQQLKAFQRVYQIVPRYEAMQTLMGAGLDSAHALTTLAAPDFVKQFGAQLGSHFQAQLVYERAQRVQGQVVTALGWVNAANSNVLPWVIGQRPNSSNGDALPAADLPATLEAVHEISAPAAAAESNDSPRATFAGLFGRLSLCECEHCRSVYSPAAYLVDLLHFLDRTPEAWLAFLSRWKDQHNGALYPFTRLDGWSWSILERTPLAILTDRRPDLLHLKLTCENTNTLIPYIDLVNEVLETYVVHNGLPTNHALGDSGTTSSAELLANPQLVNDAAYDLLKGAIYPLPLPFNRDIEIIRTYLAHLGTSRYAVMKTFQPINPPPDPAAIDLAVEYLKISREERNALTNDRGRPVLDFYGNPADPASVEGFLERTGVTYAELAVILKTRFINSGDLSAPDAVMIGAADQSCELGQRRLQLRRGTDLDDKEIYDRLQRFIRLWRKLGWPISDVARALTALGVTEATNINSDFLKRLGQIVQIKDDLGLSLAETLSLWANIDTYGDDEETRQQGSLYARLFLNATVRALTTTANLFALNPNGKVLAVESEPTNPTIAVNLQPVLAALRISATDLAAIQEALRSDGRLDDRLTLANLSTIHRYALLARALHMSVRDLLALRELSGNDPFMMPTGMVENPPGTLQEQTARFITLARKVQASGFSIPLLTYLYQHREDPAHNIGLRAEELIRHLQTVQTGLRKINEEFSTPSTEEARLRKLLAAVVAETEVVDALMTLPDGLVTFTTPFTGPLPVTFPADFNTKITYDAPRHVLRFVGAMTALERGRLMRLSGATELYIGAIRKLYNRPQELIVQSLGRLLDADDALAQLINNTASTWSVRYAYLAPRILDYLSKSFVIQTSAEMLSLEPTLAETLLTVALHSPTATTKPLLADFLALRNPSSPPVDAGQTESLPDSARHAFTLFYKAVTLVATFKLTADEVGHLAAHPTNFAGFNLDALPHVASPSVESVHANMKAWVRLYDLVTFRATLPRSDDLVALFRTATSSAGTLADAKRALLTATGWDEQTLESALGTPGFNITDRIFFANEKRLVDLADCLALAKRLGVAPARLFTWAANDPTPEQTREVQSAVKAKYDAQQWLTVAKSLNDPLRERQRDALVAFILARLRQEGSPIRTANELFEHFLIDVEMGACMATSRIKQAISSVQLFVQRCLLNVEPGVAPSALRADHWEWMGNYRIWEANRKVFLYPENWIEPELRDDKSPFFKELENELLQNDVTDETVEAAFLSYLDKLDEVARLDIRGMYWEHESELTWDRVPAAETESPDDPANRADVLHVFGRTQGTPPIYYYRCLIDHTTWTPWEKVQTDIEGDHLIPVVYNRRLHLFWPIFRETNSLDQDTPRDLTSRPDRLEIKLAWSEYGNGKWSAKQVSGPTLITRYYQNIANRRKLLFFDPYETIDGLVIRCSTLTNQYFPYNNNVYVIGDFVISGCDRKTEIKLIEAFLNSRDYRRVAPLECEIVGQMFESQGSADTMQIDEISGTLMPILNSLQTLEEARRHVYNQYRLVFSRQFAHNDLKAPIFYQDRLRTYFVTPEQVTDVVMQTQSRDQVRVIFLTSIPLTTKLSTARSLLQPSPDERSGFISASANVNSTQQLIDHNAAPQVPIGDTITSIVPAALRWATTVVCPIDWLSNSRTEQGQASTSLKLHFHTFYHPYVCEFIKALKRQGVAGLLTLDLQKKSDFTQNGTAPDDRSHTEFWRRYSPSGFVDLNYPKEDVDFENGAYALYNWELFFHIPLLIAMRLSQNQRFNEARKWFHYIFDPTTNSSDSYPRRFWQTLPFYRNDRAPQEQIDALLNLLSYRGNDPEILKRKADLEEQIEAWRNDPFNPHHIAKMRITAYQKTVVMKYIDTLIAWGDQLFRQDTIESINQATQLYVLAYLMLGKRPEIIPPKNKVPPQTYAQLQSELDAFSNALVAAENSITSPHCRPLTPKRRNGDAGNAALGMLYFCIPANDKLLDYWNKVEDRLFKIRHCMNIEGVVRQLPLFEPPIDPALLVRARAAGLDLSSVLNDIHTSLPHYRFTFVLQKALELCAEVRSLGGALLAALEKKDAEELALLRSTHELRLLEQVRLVRQKQLDEALTNEEGLIKAKIVAEHRKAFYFQRQQALVSAPNDIVTVPTPLNRHERDSMELSKAARDFQLVAGVLEIAAAVAHATPDFLGPIAKWGGSHLGSAASAASKVLSLVASEHTYLATNASTMGNYIRRAEEWQFQQVQAEKEIDQIDKQSAAAHIRAEIARQELRNHELQSEQTKAVDEFMRSRKFTRKELYDWMVTQISALYFQAYQLAYDLAKRAERTYQFERGLTTSNFVRFGQWDSLRRGLLAGEQLTLDLKRLESAHLDENRREYEITKHISLAQLNPLALIILKETGQCEIELPEVLFDLDFPGHYMRRIKSVSLTIPCVVGPYTSVNATLTLQSNKIRKESILGSNGYRETQTEPDARFIYNFAATQSIATSHAQNDNGLFELNFRDERYLPFEGAGAISKWKLELSGKWTENGASVTLTQFDFDTISDVVLHLRYTAREGGDALKGVARTTVYGSMRNAAQFPQTRLFSLRHEFPSEWHRFLNPVDVSNYNTISLALTKDRFPFLFSSATIQFTQIDLFIKIKGEPRFTTTHNASSLKLTLAAGNNALIPDTPPPTGILDLAQWPETTSKLLHGQKEFEALTPGTPGNWTLNTWLNTGGRLDAGAVEDVLLICHYTMVVH